MRSAPCWIGRTAAGMALLTPLTAGAHETRHKGLEMVHPWTFETAAAGASEIVRMRIHNHADAADRLMAASSAAAERVEVVGGDGAAGAIALPAGATVALGRDGPHLVLVGLTRRLTAYLEVPLTLHLETAGEVTVHVMVEERPAPPAAR